MSDDPGYRSGGTAGGRCGCAVALMPLFLVAPPLLIVSAIGNCAGDQLCEAGRNRDFLSQLAALVALGALLGFSVRAVVNWLARRRDPGAAGWPPLWAIAGLLGAAGLVAWLMRETWF